MRPSALLVLDTSPSQFFHLHHCAAKVFINADPIVRGLTQEVESVAATAASDPSAAATMAHLEQRLAEATHVAMNRYKMTMPLQQGPNAWVGALARCAIEGVRARCSGVSLEEGGGGDWPDWQVWPFALKAQCARCLCESSARGGESKHPIKKKNNTANPTLPSNATIYSSSGLFHRHCAGSREWRG